jgi:radical SAM superfamily enzyme YgiQ (UPF0313 family)
MQIQKITCIQLGGEFPDLCYRSVMPDYGMPLIGTLLAEAGYDVKVYMEHVKPPDWERIAQSDLVCFSSLCAGAEKTYQLADRIRHQLATPTIIGGTHATYYPESCLDHCDYVVFGEGDETILELVAALSENCDVSKISGIAYRDNGQARRTPARKGPERFETVPDFSLIQGYRKMNWLDMLWQRRAPWLTAQASRGCYFKCRFCIVNTMFPSGYRKRDIESVIRDLRDKRQYGRNLMFVDNDFPANRHQTKQLLRRIIEEDLDYNFLVFARIEMARDEELMELMRRAGVSQLYQGYESIQPETLTAYDKYQTLKQVCEAIKKEKSYGFRLIGSFVVGADTDTLETIQRTADFVIEQQLSSAYFFPIWGHFPEQLHGHQTIVPWYRSIFRGWKYCDGNFVSHYPLNMPPSKLQRALIDTFRRVYAPRHAFRTWREGSWEDAKWKLGHIVLWRDIERNVREHVGFLEELEDGLYDSSGHLLEEKLAERVRRDPRWTFDAGNRAIKTLGLSPLELPVARDNNITCVPSRPAPVATPN